MITGLIKAKNNRLTVKKNYCCSYSCLVALMEICLGINTVMLVVIPSILMNNLATCLSYTDTKELL